MTDERLEEIRQREQRATKGPWEAKYDLLWSALGHRLALFHVNAQDTAFCAHARTDIPELLAEVDRRKTARSEAIDEIKQLRAELKDEVCNSAWEADRAQKAIDDCACLRAENARLRAELSLRTMMYPPSEIPQEFRVHGQHAAYHSGFEHAWRGHPRENCYEFHTAQHRAWDRGFADGASAFAAAFAATLEAKSE